jgi:HNH endonuclease
MSADREFSLREFAVDLWDELDRCDQYVLAKEIALRIPPHQRLRALEEAAVAFADQVIRGQRRARAVKMPLRERLERRTEYVGDCFIWTGKTGSNGYGAITISVDGRRKCRALHRVSYEEFIGPIPDGYQVDHACHSDNPEACPGRPNCLHILCWNPEHLRAVTRLENMQGRKSQPGWLARNGRRKTHCKRGHEFTPENTYVPPNNPYAQVCKECRNLRSRERYELRRAA